MTEETTVTNPEEHPLYGDPLRESNYPKWLGLCLRTGIPAIATSTAAQLMAVVSLCDGPAIRHCARLQADMNYIRQRWHFNGTATEDPYMTVQLNKYVRMIITEQERHYGSGRRFNRAPDWCRNLMMRRYGIKIY